MRRIILLAFVSLTTPVHGQEPTSETAQYQHAMDNVSHEFTRCSAYYLLVAEALRKSGNEELGAQYDLTAEDVFNLALEAAKSSRSDEMAEKVFTAHLEIEGKLMLDEIENDASNMSLLNVKHAEQCKLVMEDVEAAIDEWLNE